MAQARKDYAYAVAGHNRSHDRNVAQKDADYQTGASLRERDYQNALTALRLDPNTGGLNYDGPDFMWKYVAWNFKPWAGVSQGTSGTVPDDIAQEVRYTVLAPFRWNQKDLEYWLATAAIDRQYATSAYNNSGYVSAKLSLLASYREQLQAEDEVYQLARAAAERTKVIGTGGSGGDVQAHRAWVIGIEDEDVLLAQGVQAAGDALADALKAATIGLSTGEANAANAFTHELDAAVKSYGDASANADNGYDKGVVVVNNQLRSALVSAGDTQSHSTIVARNVYETTLYTEHKTKLQNATLPANPGILANLRAYHLAVATEDVAWSQGQGAAALARQQSQSAANQMQLYGGTNVDGEVLPGELLSNQNHVNSTADSTKTHAHASNGLLQTLDDSNADAIKDAVIGVRSAEAADAARQVKAEDKYDVARQIAERAYQTKAEDALVAWATTVENAKYDYWANYESERFHAPNSSTYTTAHNNNLARAATRDAAIEAADVPFKAALKQARIDHASDIGDAQIVRAHEVTQSAQTREGEAGDAIIAGQQDMNSADDSYLSGKGGADLARATSSGQADKAFAEDSAKLSQLATHLQGEGAIYYACTSGPINATRAANVAAAEGALHLAIAQAIDTQLAAVFAAASTSDPNWKYLQFKSAEAHAYAQWISGMIAPYVAYVTAMQAAADAEGQALVMADAGNSNVSALNDRNSRIADAGWQYTDRLEDTSATNAHRIATGSISHARSEEYPTDDRLLLVGYAAMEENWQVARTSAEKNYQMALAALDEGQTVSSAALQAYWHGKAQAEYDWQIAYSACDLTWSTSMANDDQAYLDDLADEIEQYASGQAGRTKNRALAGTPAREAAALAHAETQADLNTARTNASNQRRTSEYLAAGSWVAASMTELDTVLASAATAVGLPWMDTESDLAGVKSQWWSSTGQTAWLALGAALNARDTTYTAAVNDLETGLDAYATRIAELDREFGEAVANDRYARAIDELAAAEAWTVNDDAADKDYQVALAQTRITFRNGVAALVLAYSGSMDTEGISAGELPGYEALVLENAASRADALDAWTAQIAQGEGDYLDAMADALREFTSSYALHWRAHDLAVADAQRDRSLGLAAVQEARDSGVADDLYNYANSYYTSSAAAIHSYATTNITPWSKLADSVAAAERDREITEADAQRDRHSAAATDDRELGDIVAYAAHAQDTANIDSEVDQWIAGNLANAGRQEDRGNALIAWSQAPGHHDRQALAEAPNDGEGEAGGEPDASNKTPPAEMSAVDPFGTGRWKGFSAQDYQAAAAKAEEQRAAWQAAQNQASNPASRIQPMPSMSSPAAPTQPHGFTQQASTITTVSAFRAGPSAGGAIVQADAQFTMPSQGMNPPPPTPRPPRKLTPDEAVYINEDGTATASLEMLINQVVFRIKEGRWADPISARRYAAASRLSHQQFLDGMANENVIPYYEGDGWDSRIGNVGIGAANGTKNVAVQFANGMYFGSVPELHEASERMAQSAKDRGAIGAQVVYGTANVAGKSATVAFVVFAVPAVAAGATEAGVGGSVQLGSFYVPEITAEGVAAAGVWLKPVGATVLGAFGAKSTIDGVKAAKKGDFYHATINFEEAAFTFYGAGALAKGSKAAVTASEYRTVYANGRYYMVTAEGEVIPMAAIEGPTIGRSGYRTMDEFSEAVLARYQRYIDEGYLRGLRAQANGLFRPRAGISDDTILGQYVDGFARRRLRNWLTSEGIPEGPSEIIQVNRWLRDPSGSGAYRIPDVRLRGARLIYDGTIGTGKLATSPQLIEFHGYSNGDNIIIVMPTELGGSYGVVFQ